ncbi:MAG: orotidine-5'-phosphate decarboxylase [Candidatus Thermoplasmatota archaeon]
MQESFNARLAASAKRAGSWLCVGLDPDPEHYPADMTSEDTLEFLLTVAEATAGVACAVKPNAAFFEALGAVGHEALYGLVERLPPGLPVILDGKRNDIGNTAAKYAEAAFEDLGVDAVTVTPYLGRDTVEPFADYVDKGVFLLARTSNASAGDFQDLDVGGQKLYQAVAKKAMAWNKEWHNLGLVAGATYPGELADLRTICGDGVPLLIPGVGAQGADARTTIQKGADSHGHFAVVNVGRAILQAGKGDDWREQVRAAARKFAADLAPPRTDKGA